MRVPPGPRPPVGFILIALFSLFQAASDGCGTTKGCFQSPAGCTGPEDCDFYVSWAKSGGNNLMFELSGKSTSYIALGFSRSGKMVSFDCTVNQDY